MIEAIKDKVVGILMVRNKTAGGLILPEGATDPQAYCKVISVGNEVENIKVGDIVVCHIRGGMDAVFEKEITKVLKEDEIYGVLTHEPTIQCLKEIELTSEKKEKSNIVRI